MVERYYAMRCDGAGVCDGGKPMVDGGLMMVDGDGDGMGRYGYGYGDRDGMVCMVWWQLSDSQEGAVINWEIWEISYSRQSHLLANEN
ncbi:hypothetical protein LB507_000526, partial [Fusarium sp. FIESC RH6]